MLTLLTATGCRPEAWAISERLAAKQTYSGKVRWIVVDDGEQAQPVTFAREGWALEVIRRGPYWQEGRNTQAENLLAGLAVVGKDERLVIWEDDDHYAPDWLETVDAYLDEADLVGEVQARYYNVQTKAFKQLKNTKHASLCSTAVKGDGIAALRRECSPGVQFIDLNLWKSFRGTKRLFGGNRVTGIKGMPGRGGIGMGHKPTFAGTQDVDGRVLRQWIGNDADAYRGKE